MKKILLASLILSLWGPSALARSVDVNLSNDAARFMVRGDTQVRGMGDSGTELGLAYNENDDIFLHYGFQVQSGARGRTAWEAGAGVRLIAGIIDLPQENQELAALGIGGRLQFNPFLSNRLGFGLEGYYAPPIVNFGDSEKYWEAEFTIRLQLMTTAEIYAGVRKIEVDLDGFQQSYEFDDGGFVGLKLGF